MAFTAASVIAGFVMGGLLGELGTAMSPEGRSTLLFALAVAGVGVAGAQLVGYRFGPPQKNRETPKAWIYHGAARWALLNGVALGLGFTSRIGFWLWYVVPVTAFLSADPVVGASAYGTYAFLRTGGVWLIVPASRKAGGKFVALALTRRISYARAFADIQLLLVGVVAAASVWK